MLKKFGDYQTDIPDISEEQRERKRKIDETLAEIKELSPGSSVRHDNKISFEGEKKYFDAEDLESIKDLLEILEKME